ncbi:cyclophilin-like fold protein [Streptomyces sp. NPDC096132]|uniref:cyclophilin-like fold protein n=1 Tax=Streptomyces sp. NPDC096132 TaxID=3366075 RepID=UPI0038175B28
MPPAPLRTLTRTLPATALLVAATACTEDAPSAPRSSASTPHQSPTAPAPAAPSDRNAPGHTPRNTAMDIRLTLDGRQVDATLNDSATARDFASLLPLTLRLSDFHRTERIADLPRRLSTAGAPEAAEAEAGDLAYYAPWGNLAVYYRDGGSRDTGLIILGHVADADTRRLAAAEEITIEAVA